MVWASGNYGIEINITKKDAQSASHQGDCEQDVKSLSNKPYVRKQLNAIDKNDLIKELKGYGAWSEEELQDHEQNLQRILWIFAVDIVERR